MFITYRRVGRSALLPALGAAGVLVIVGGIAATIAVVTVAIVGGLAGSATLLRAFGIGTTKRSFIFPAVDTVEGVVVNRSSAVSEPRLQPAMRSLSHAEDPR